MKLLGYLMAYGGWAEVMAKSTGAFFFDLNDFVASQYESTGQERVAKEFFLADHTHTTPAGAAFNAQAVVFGITKLKNCFLASYLDKKPDSPEDR